MTLFLFPGTVVWWRKGKVQTHQDLKKNIQRTFWIFFLRCNLNILTYSSMGSPTVGAYVMRYCMTGPSACSQVTERVLVVGS